MRKRYLIMILSVAFVGLLSAQPGDQKRADRIEAKKIAYISNALDLSPDEAKVFWPVYNGHSGRVKAIKDNFNAGKKLELMSDNELEQWIDNSLVKEQELLEEKKIFLAELKKVLPIRKIGILYKTEKKFRKSVLKEMRKRMKNKEKNKNRRRD